jgi:hypothetical protein
LKPSQVLAPATTGERAQGGAGMAPDAGQRLLDGGPTGAVAPMPRAGRAMDAGAGEGRRGRAGVAPDLEQGRSSEAARSCWLAQPRVDRASLSETVLT